MVSATVRRIYIKMNEKEKINFRLKKRLFEIIPKNNRSLIRKLANLKYSNKELELLIRRFEK